MCERYALSDRPTAEREFAPDRAWWQFTARYNVAPQQFVPAIRSHGGQSEALMMRWGLIPARGVGRPTVRPPAEVAAGDLLDSPLYRTPWLNSQRCILPAAGFYVWRLTEAKYHQPYFVRLLDRNVFGLAAIWDRSDDEAGTVVESCSIISVAPNSLIMNLANTVRRMPAILRRKDYATWLRGTPAEAKAALCTYGAAGMLAYAVSPRINSTAPDDSGLIEPVR